MNPDERLIAYVDGELPAPDRAVFEAEMAADPALAARVAGHRRLSARISGAYAPVLDEPVPAQLIAVASSANDRGPRGSLPWWAAMAACLVVGVLGGRAFWPEQGPLAVRGGELVARDSLDRALTTQLASQGGVVKVGLTFRARDGRYCRTFRSVRDNLAGVACRRDGRWVTLAATAWTPQPSPDYRTAASGDPPAVLATVDAAIAGETLDPAAERAARDRGWKP